MYRVLLNLIYATSATAHRPLKFVRAEVDDNNNNNNNNNEHICITQNKNPQMR